ncbi:hypothetical protein [Aeromicrobium fastidiosum]|uniref:Uncharacterized protein n=1 Tax=Aeromicrobium fastidiosum TaxID=52699 RepID=A0A641AT62_9ACTN|nr:hypothetical protein [Aeromicrobium fastidiosum]KAA1380241.1 hypothetical protein ESP62_003330 [Aeromicrobium fastidiosum]MBP2389792.1 nitrogen fixation-related uncharacterized protein [Aeromicrobium fastidiosum]
MTTTPPEPDQPFGAGQTPYPGQQPAQPAYGAYPTGPAGAPRQGPPAPEQPASISLAVKLMGAGAGVSLISLIVSLLGLGSLKDDIARQMREADPSVTQSTIDAAYAVGIVFAIVVGAISVLLWLWMAWKNGQGRSWARVTATVLGALNVVFTLFGFAAGGVETPTLLLSVVNLVLAVVILVLLWRKESTQFFEGHTAARRLY